MPESKNYYLICYDIRDPKRWRQVFKLLKGYGEPVQYSIIRCRLTTREREQLRWELEKLLNEEDSLLIAGLCDRCVERIQSCNRPESWAIPEDSHRIF